MTTLFIAEKPSLAREIVKCLKPPHVKKDGYIETAEGTVTWAFGHILRAAEPGEYEEKYKNWVEDDLPIIPSEWKLLISSASAKQFEIIKELIEKAHEIINAGDPDREGQLLIDEILDFVENKKPVKRILLNALDEKSVIKALGNIRDNRDFRTLKESALARQRADWLIGMNSTRAYTMAARKVGHTGVFNIGRVKTPTLSLVVRREEEIKNFKSVTYYTINGNFSHPGGAISAKWKAKEGQPGLDEEGRLVDKNAVDALLNKFKTSRATPAKITSIEITTETEPNRLPFSLSALQIAAGKKFGYDPQTVLDTAQSLYEKRFTSYPRSDCDYLPENQLEDAAGILNNLKALGHADLANWSAGADLAIKSRAWNDKKITAHHAIIPTLQACNFNALSDNEKNIYFLIAQNFISQFYPVHSFEKTRICLNYADEDFIATGRVVIEEGWKKLYRAEDAENEDNDEEATLPKAAQGDTAEYVVAAVKEQKTTPPKRFTQSTLLQAMKEIHKYVKDKELQKQLKDVSGIGTEATRAGIIKDLTDKGFLTEQKKYLYPTEKAIVLIAVLPDELTYPDSTAKWEGALEKIVQGGANLNEFLAQQEAFITLLCQKAMGITMREAAGTKCPTCQSGVLRKKNGVNGSFWGCSRYPECKAAFADDKDKPQVIPCPACKKNTLRKRTGPKGDFWACAGFPDCRATFEDKKGKPVFEKEKEKEKKPEAEGKKATKKRTSS